MSYYLFDNPRYLLALALVTEAVLFLVWAITRQKLKSRYLLIGVALAGLAVLLDFLVETNREQLERHTRTLVQAAEDEDAQTIVNLFSNDFKLQNGINRERASQIIHAYFAKPLIANNHIDQLTIIRDDDTHGTVEFTATTVIDHKSDFALVRVVKTSWQLEFSRPTDQQYQIRDIVMTSINNENPIDIWNFKL